MSFRWFAAVLLALPIVLPATAADDAVQGQAFAPPRKDWEWDEDKRFDFLIERLASLEASLDAVEKAIAKTSRSRGARQGDARRAESGNAMMDRKGGGPMRWSEFYGTTAERFFYHPVDPNTTYHTTTALRQMGSSQDDKVGDGVPASQSLPVHQRPPQFDYIYRANRDAKERAEREAVVLAGKVEELERRRSQLESEQAELWCRLAFRAIERRNIPKKPLLRFILRPATTDTADVQEVDALSAAMRFLATALIVVDKAEDDQATALAGIAEVVGQARTSFDDALINLDTLTEDAADKRRPLGQFVALAQLLDDTANNLSESYEVAIDGERFKDADRKERFRGLLQRSLIEYAQIILALDELGDTMRRQWQIKVDTKAPVEDLQVVWTQSPRQPRAVPDSPATDSEPARPPARDIDLIAGDSLDGWSGPGAGGRPNWAVQKGVLVCTAEGGELVSDQSFGDFDLHMEFFLPPGCNSGIYLRGSVEVQLLDTSLPPTGGKPVPLSGRTGSVWGQLAVSRDAYLPGKWNTMDIHLVGSTISVMLNGARVVDEGRITGPTPGAKSNANLHHGPLLIQSHTNMKGMKIRSLVIRPLEDVGR